MGSTPHAFDDTLTLRPALANPPAVTNGAFSATPSPTSAPQGATAGTGLGAFGVPRPVYNPNSDVFSTLPGSNLFAQAAATSAVTAKLAAVYGPLAAFVPYTGDPSNPVAPYFLAMSPAAQLAFLQQQQAQATAHYNSYTASGVYAAPVATPPGQIPTAATIAAGLKKAGAVVVSDSGAAAQGPMSYNPSSGYTPAAGVAPTDMSPTIPAFTKPAAQNPGAVATSTGSGATGGTSTAAAAAKGTAGAPGTSGVVTPETTSSTNHFFILIVVAIALIVLSRS